MTAAEFFTNEGREEGKADRDIEHAINGLRKGYAIEAIVDITGLDIKVVEQLKSQLSDES